MSGEVSATGGTIGGFDIADTTISTTGVTLGNSTEDLFISSSQFKVDHEGNITASNIDLGGTISATSGDVGGFEYITENINYSIGQTTLDLATQASDLFLHENDVFFYTLPNLHQKISQFTRKNVHASWSPTQIDFCV